MTNLENKIYDIIHFEALGKEKDHLEEEIQKAIFAGQLPKNHKYLITHLNMQQFLTENPGFILPVTTTIKTHSLFLDSYVLPVDKVPEEYHILADKISIDKNIPREYCLQLAFAEASDDLINQVMEGFEKKSSISRSAGYDHVEHLQKFMNIASLREYCVNAVAETLIKFMFACSGELNHYSYKTGTFDRKTSKVFKEMTGRTAAVFGLGRIGKRAYDMLEGFGINVLAIDIRQEELLKDYGGKINFVSKEYALPIADAIFNLMSYNKTGRFKNIGYFTDEDFEKTKDGIIILNGTRGPILPEHRVLRWYQDGKVGGIGLDVFTEESMFADLINGKITTDNIDLLAAKQIVDMALGNMSIEEIEFAINQTIDQYKTGKLKPHITEKNIPEMVNVLAKYVHAVNSRERPNIYVSPHQGFNSDVAAETKAVEAIKHVVAFYKNNMQKFDEQLPYYT